MNVNEFNQALNQNGLSSVAFVLPSGELIPAHFHVTEVGRVDRTFIDCGGTQRSTSACLLQVWTANDYSHRLEPHKLGRIMALAAPILRSESLPVEVEYGEEVASQYAVDHFESTFGTLKFILAPKRTDCLAKDQCGVDGCDTAGCCSTPSAVAAPSVSQAGCNCGPAC